MARKSLNFHGQKQARKFARCAGGKKAGVRVTKRPYKARKVFGGGYWSVDMPKSRKVPKKCKALRK